ncbi:MAG: tetratricopeptide repeat protein [Bacteroidales bacterium]|nr:tetratricopeptide repeat protein [Bacteroidales bacterium]
MSITKYIYKTTLLILVVIISFQVFCQNKVKIDSLNNELINTNEDSIKVNILSELFWAYQRSNPDTALIFAEKALEISQANSFKENIAESTRQIGILKKVQGDYHEALNLFVESKNYYLQTNDTSGTYTCLIDIGDVYYRQNNFLPAIEYYYEALEFVLLSEDKETLGRIYHKLGGIYYQQKQYNKALEYHTKSLEINLDLDFELGISVNYNNIGNAYLDMYQYFKAEENYQKSLEIKKKRNDKRGIASTLTNIAIVFMEQKEFQKAITYHKQELDMYKELDNKPGMAICLGNLANDYLQANNMALAIDYANKSLKLLENTNLIQTQCETYRVLSEAYASQMQYKKAWEYQKLYKIYNDSTVNIDVVRQITEMESKSEMEKKEKEIALLNSEKEKQSLKIQKQDLQRDLMIGVILLVLSVLIFLYWIFRNKQKLNKKLEELNLTKSRFFANISHEFRTPLTLLLGPLEQLLKNPKQEEKEMIGMMFRNASRLLFLDNQLLDLAKLESGKLKLEVGCSNISQAIKGMALSFQSLAEKKKIDFKCSFPEQEIQSFFDQDKLEKIVYNLLSNALKFTSQNGQVIFELSLISDKRKKELPSKFRKIQGQVVCISVTDTGPGIAKEHLPFIFDRFYQVDSRLNRNFEGTGLGLSLTKELIELHHGKISVESEPGKGSTFIVCLPIDKIAFDTNEIIEAGDVSFKTSIFTNNLQTENKLEKQDIKEGSDKELSEEELLQLLIVEDNSDMRSYIRNCFDGQYNILEAADGLSGYKTAISKIPDIIITDLMMPRMDGIELCNKLKTDERTSHIPVILLTALSSVEDRVLGLETGADDYIAKPFNRQELLTRVQNLTMQRKLLRERFGKEIKIQAKDIAVTSADEKFLNKLILFIENNIADPDLNVDSLTEQIHLSRSQLHRKLKALTDMSSTEFIRNIRLKRAAQLLEQHHGTIAETVYAVGFNSLSYFSKCFQKQFGLTPKEYIEHTQT